MCKQIVFNVIASVENNFNDRFQFIRIELNYTSCKNRKLAFTLFSIKININ